MTISTQTNIGILVCLSTSLHCIIIFPSFSNHLLVDFHLFLVAVHLSLLQLPPPFPAEYPSLLLQSYSAVQSSLLGSSHNPEFVITSPSNPRTSSFPRELYSLYMSRVKCYSTVTPVYTNGSSLLLVCSSVSRRNHIMSASCR